MGSRTGPQTHPRSQGFYTTQLPQPRLWKRVLGQHMGTPRLPKLGPAWHWERGLCPCPCTACVTLDRPPGLLRPLLPHLCRTKERAWLRVIPNLDGSQMGHFITLASVVSSENWAHSEHPHRAVERKAQCHRDMHRALGPVHPDGWAHSEPSEPKTPAQGHWHIVGSRGRGLTHSRFSGNAC